MEEPVAYATTPPGVKLPVLPCPVCGLIEVVILGPGRGPHVGELRCRAGHFIKWAPKALLGLAPEERRMGGIARCTVVGCVSKHGIEVHYATSGTPCASFMLVESEQGSDGKMHDLWVMCEIWDKKAETTGELEPGQLVLFEGKLARRKKGEQWETTVVGFEATPILTPVAPVPGGNN